MDGSALLEGQCRGGGRNGKFCVTVPPDARIAAIFSPYMFS